MTVEQRTSGRVIILDVQGRMTIETAGNMALAEIVRRLLPQGHKSIVVNLAGVPSLDSCGLCNLVDAYVAATRRGGSLKLLYLTPPIRKILAVTRLLTIFEVYDSEADAVASFGSSAPA